MMYLGQNPVGIAYSANNVIIVDIPENTIASSDKVSEFFINKIPQPFDFYTVIQIDFDRTTAKNNQLVCAAYINGMSAQHGVRYRDGAFVGFNYANTQYDNRLNPGTRYILVYGKEVTPNA